MLNNFLPLLKGKGSKFAGKKSSSHCSKWTEIVDCRGLIHVSNIVHDLFMLLEMTVMIRKAIEKVRRERLALRRSVKAIGQKIEQCQ